MANEIVSINNNKENILEFDLSVEGIPSKDINAKLVIHANEMELGFQCIKKEGDKWTVTLPALPILERTAYPFHFDIIADGYHFEPMKGTINVVGSHDLYISQPKNPSVTSSVTEKKTEPKIKKEAVVVHRVEPTKQREKPIEQIARELMEANANKKFAPPKKVEATKPVEQKPVANESILPVIAKEEKKTASGDAKTLKILEEAGIRVKQKPKTRFSIKD
jgi:hypothetical protein